MTDTHKLVEALSNSISVKGVVCGFMFSKQHCDALAADAIRGIEASGYRVVPVEMTDEMRNAARLRRIDDGWAAALAACPKVTP